MTRRVGSKSVEFPSSIVQIVCCYWRPYWVLSEIPSVHRDQSRLEDDLNNSGDKRNEIRDNMEGMYQVTKLW
jgi:hypothetical protein